MNELDTKSALYQHLAAATEQIGLQNGHYTVHVCGGIPKVLKAEITIQLEDSTQPQGPITTTS